MAACPADCPTCRRLEGAALSLIGLDGVEAVTEQMVAARLGEPASVLGSHVGGSRALVIRTYDRATDRLIALWSDAFGTAETWASGLRRAVQLTLATLALDFPTCRLLFLETLRDGDLRRRRADARGRLCALLAADHARRADERLPRVQFELLVGCLSREISDEIVAGRRESLPGAEQRLLAMSAVFDPLLV